jgi:hypothetical protein
VRTGPGAAPVAPRRVTPSTGYSIQSGGMFCYEFRRFVVNALAVGTADPHKEER